MPALQTVYIMAFTPEKMDNNTLISVCRMAADMLSAKDKNFAQKMGMIGKTTRMTFSNQLYLSTMHTPQNMQTTLGGWVKNENMPFAPVLGDTFFPHGMRDPKGRENFFLFYFHITN